MKLAATLLSAALVGCAAQRTTGPSGAELIAADPSNQCFQKVTEQFSGGVLGKKISFGGMPSLEMVIDKSKPTAQEKEALSQLSAGRQQCFEQGRAYRAQHLPGPIALAIEEGTSATTMLMAKLYAGELTYAQFNIARDENLSRYKAKLVEYDRQANQAQAQAIADEATRRQSAANALLQTQQAIQAQQQVSPAPTYQIVQPPTFRTPTTTNCQRWGNQVNCTTY